MRRINYLAVVVSALAAFALGALWYGVLFDKAWVKAHGYTADQVAAMQQDAPRAYAISLVCFLVMAFVLAHLRAATGAVSAAQGARLGFVVWLGFALTLGLIASVYNNQPLSVLVIDSGYQLVYLLIMGAILGAWRPRTA